MSYLDIALTGYRRDNGRVGIRNYVLIIPVDDISNAAATGVEALVRGTIAIPHPYGRLQFGADLDLTLDTLIGYGRNPNVAAAIVIGIEPNWTNHIVEGIADTGKPVSGPLLQPGDAAPPPPAPVTTAPAPTSTTTSPAPTPTRASTRPGAPRAVRVKAKKRRLVVRWAAPQPNGSKRIKKYRAKVYRVKANGKLKYRTKCFAKAKKRKCRTKKLKRRTTYVVKVQARNKKGYGQASTLVRYRLK